MENICSVCVNHPNAHSFMCLCQTINNKYIFYTKFASAKLYNDTEYIIRNIYINDNDFYFITTNNKLYKNLNLNTNDFSFQLFKSKYEIFGYYNHTNTSILQEEYFETSEIDLTDDICLYFQVSNLSGKNSVYSTIYRLSAVDESLLRHGGFGQVARTRCGRTHR